MAIQFYKYQGAGNDFVIIDDRELSFDTNNQDLIQRICDRRFGIGGDGLMLLQNSSDYDFRMVYFNSDGKEGSMCGNGGRCLVRFAYDLGVIGKKTNFIAVDGPHEAELDEQGLVHLKMINVDEIQQKGTDFFMNTGSPHYVSFVNDLEHMDVFQKGRAIRYNDEFKKEGTNVNFCEVKSHANLFVRTYERGVEDETLACGTGVTAVALAYALQNNLQEKIDVKVLGGDLAISYNKTEQGFNNVFLIGPAKFVFKGVLNVSDLK